MQPDTSLAAAFGAWQPRLGKAAPASFTAWQRVVAELLSGPQQPRRESELNRLFQETSLQSPATTATASLGQLAEALAPFPRGTKQAPVIAALARWWLRTWGDDVDPDWRHDLEQCRRELRRIRGLGPETADRLLLFAAGQRVFPVERAALRIAVRHDWLDVPVDDAAAQALFRRAAGDDVTGLQQLSRWLHELGATHCGRIPQCAGCPLEPYLPVGGPHEPPDST
jgi:endonuclease-3 related protein